MQNDLNEHEEYSDLVDENDNIIGRKLTVEARREGVRNMRVANAFLVNSKGELWIPRRHAKKEHFPLCLDMSIAGHVSSGETYEETFKREAQEELNLNVDKYQPRLLGYLTPKDGVMFMKVYEIKSDETPDYNKEEFCEDFWFSPQELVRRIEQGEKSKNDLSILVKRFYL